MSEFYQYVDNLHIFGHHECFIVFLFLTMFYHNFLLHCGPIYLS